MKVNGAEYAINSNISWLFYFKLKMEVSLRLLLSLILHLVGPAPSNIQSQDIQVLVATS